MTATCAHCAQPCRLTDGREVYPHRRDLAALRFWVCDPCDSRVGCHKPGARTDTGESDGTMPLGTAANADLRNARSHVHRLIDPLWRNAPRKQRRTARRRVYRLLRRIVGTSALETHVGMFNIDQCRTAYAGMKGMTCERVMTEGHFDPVTDEDEPAGARI